MVMMMETVFPIPQPTTIPVLGTTAVFPVRRIFCVGRNYADHAKEMGALDQASGAEPPFFFYKPTDALVSGEGELTIHYPPQTADLHHEIEMVVALQAGGSNIPVTEALEKVFAYGVGLDLTRRDMQAKAKAKGHPWDMSKGFDQSAVCAPLTPVSHCGHLPAGDIRLYKNGELKQAGNLNCMAWDVAHIIHALSQLVCLAPGDIIYTGTPAGVGAVAVGDTLLGTVTGLAELRVRVVAD